MSNINNRVFGQNVDLKIIKQFDRLQRGRFNTNPNQEIRPEDDFKDYLGERSTFARMWTALVVTGSKNSKEDPLKKIAVKPEVKFHVINDNNVNNKDYEINTPVSDSAVFHELSTNPFLKPKAGITSITNKTEGALGAIKRTTVEFVVHNKKDFEDIFLPFFLKPGATVVVDYGWSDPSVNLYSIEERVTNTDLELSTFKKFIYGGYNGEVPNVEYTGTEEQKSILFSIDPDLKGANFETRKNVWDALKGQVDGFIPDYQGIVDVVVGRVTTYSSKVNQQGSFECSIELTSENTTLLDFEITDENKLKFLFTNKIEMEIIKFLTGEDNTSNEITLYNAYSAEERKKIRNKFYDDLEISGSVSSEQAIGNPLIPDKSIKNGLFYQNIVGFAGAAKNKKEILYISYGLFEDLFLNQYIAVSGMSRESTQINFENGLSKVRFNDSLLQRQKQQFLETNDEALPLFLYPQNWGISDNYNDNTQESFKNDKSDLNQYKTPVIPLRDLFISVPLISSAFKSKQNVNDALEYIFEEINRDSYDVFKIKMSSNEAGSNISFTDVNLLPVTPKKDEMLMFDVTSNRSIVNNFDYNFTMPKGGLSAMIAIGENVDNEYFDDATKDYLNFIRILESDRFGDDADFLSLPLRTIRPDSNKTDETEEEKQFKIRYIKPIRDNLPISVTKGSFAEAVNSITNASITKNKNLNKATGSIVTDEQIKPKVTLDPKKQYANSDRDQLGRQARINSVYQTGEDKISPILPIQLSLGIYGNTYLNVGDNFLINYLPDIYFDKVYFQIVGVEQKISTAGWETTYSTIMRVRPNQKDKVTGIPEVVLSADAVSHNQDDTTDQNAITIYADQIVTEDNDTTAKRVVTDPSKTNKIIDKKSGNDRRKLKNYFGQPVSKEDFCYMYAWNKFIMIAMEGFKAQGKKGLYYLTKDITKLEFIEEETTEKLDEYDFIAMVLVEDKDGFLFGEHNAIIEYYQNLFPLAKEEEYKGLIKSFATKSYMKKMYEDLVSAKNAGIGGLTGNKIHYNGEVTKVIDESYGGLIVKWMFKYFDYETVNPGESSEYVVANWRPARLTEGFKSSLDFQIAQWFLLGSGSGNVNDLFEGLKSEYFSLLKDGTSKFAEIFKKVTERRLSQKRRMKGTRFGGMTNP